MSTPPPLPDDSFEPSPRSPERSVLAKVAAILAAILLLTFGLCTATSMREGTAATIGAISGGIALICVAALVVVGFISLLKSRT